MYELEVLAGKMSNMMTVKQVAEALGYEEDTIRKKVKDLYPESVSIGKTTYLTEMQVGTIKANLVPRTLALKSGVELATTNIEMLKKTSEVMEWLAGQIDKERSLRKEAENRTNRLIHNNQTYTTTEIAKELGFKSAQELNEDLHARGVQYKDSRGVWILYSEYSGHGLQNIKQKEINGAPRYYSEWTGIGRDWLNGLYITDSGIV